MIWIRISSIKGAQYKIKMIITRMDNIFLYLYYTAENSFLVDIDVPLEALQTYRSAFLPDEVW